MMKAAVCIEMLFPGADPCDKIREIARQGFSHVEFWGWKDKDIGKIAGITRNEGVKVVNFSGQRRGDLIDRKTHRLVLEDIGESVEIANILDTSVLMVLTNELGDGGRVMHPCDGISGKVKYASLVEGLGRIMEEVPVNMTIVLEPLNTVLDHENYYLHDIKTARKIVHDVGSPRLKILCDLYHQGMMGDDPMEILRTGLQDIGYIHIADYPGRHEPGTGRGDWASILRAVRDSAWEGFVGFEYCPFGDSGESLKSIKGLWDGVMK